MTEQVLVMRTLRQPGRRLRDRAVSTRRSDDGADDRPCARESQVVVRVVPRTRARTSGSRNAVDRIAPIRQRVPSRRTRLRTARSAGEAI